MFVFFVSLTALLQLPHLRFSFDVIEKKISARFLFDVIEKKFRTSLMAKKFAVPRSFSNVKMWWTNFRRGFCFFFAILSLSSHYNIFVTCSSNARSMKLFLANRCATALRDGVTVTILGNSSDVKCIFRREAINDAKAVDTATISYYDSSMMAIPARNGRATVRKVLVLSTITVYTQVSFHFNFSVFVPFFGRA